MAHDAGTRIGHYQLQALIGEGGMGEVYRANDTKLHRDVAVKVLPSQFTSDPERMERFQREAHVLASLNHPQIAAIYGLEDAPPIRALVMELVEGPTLAERLTGGRAGQAGLAIDEALSIAKQIAEALEYSHERGIVHRDLKPANIKLTHDGHVKVLDFGLAKALTGAGAPDGAIATAGSASMSPTIALGATQAGVILGTASYMSPEQAKGKAVDRRADIWAFGAILFEMLAGRMLYSGETVSETMAHVIMKDPDWDALPASTPPRLVSLLRRCLVKDPRNRARDIGDVRIAIEEIIAKPGDDVVAGAPQGLASGPNVKQASASRAGWIPWAVAAVAIAIAAGAVISSWRAASFPTTPTMRLTAKLGVDGTVATGMGAAVVVSPDGNTIAFVASKSVGQTTQLYVRRLDQAQAVALSGTLGARDAFFSPDGQWLGFFADGKLKKVSVLGGAAITICEAADDRGGTWTDDGWIVFTPTTRSSLYRVRAAGGAPEALTTLDAGTSEITHRWPAAVAGSSAVLFTASSVSNSYEDAVIKAHSLKTGEDKVVARGGYYPRHVGSGHVTYLHDGTLFGAAFDAVGLQMTGQPIPVLEGVMTSPQNGGAQVSFSASGRMTYLAGSGGMSKAGLFWLQHGSKAVAMRPDAGAFFSPSFSPDGKRLALEMAEPQDDLWIYEVERGAMTRVTFDVARDGPVIWTPDGRRLTFTSTREKPSYNLFWMRSDLSGDVQRLTTSPNVQIAGSWHPQGRVLAFTEVRGPTATDIMLLPIEGSEAEGWKPGQPTVFLATQASEMDPAFSPDGHWLAYASNQGGQIEVFVRPFPGPGGERQISTNGGTQPIWSPRGTEIYYRSLDQHIMKVTYAAVGSSVQVGTPAVWSEEPLTPRSTDLVRVSAYSLHPDGQRFAVLMAPDDRNTSKLDEASFIFNFSDELRRLISAH